MSSLLDEEPSSGWGCGVQRAVGGAQAGDAAGGGRAQLGSEGRGGLLASVQSLAALCHAGGGQLCFHSLRGALAVLQQGAEGGIIAPFVLLIQLAESGARCGAALLPGCTEAAVAVLSCRPQAALEPGPPGQEGGGGGGGCAGCLGYSIAERLPQGGVGCEVEAHALRQGAAAASRRRGEQGQGDGTVIGD